MEKYLQPAEWEPHESCWLAWPHNDELWGESISDVRKEFTDLCRAISGENLNVLVATPQAHQQAEEALKGLPAKFHSILYGDIWLRDTAPIFTHAHGTTAACVFKFNGWGEKYVLEGDAEVGKNIASVARRPTRFFPFVLEGGSVEVDGLGTCLTTEQCLLNPNRGNRSKEEIEKDLKDSLGIEKVLWLKEGLKNDHTDGHIDTLARFLAPGIVGCMSPEKGDPNYDVLVEIKKTLAGMTDAQGRKLQVFDIPSPGRVLSEEDDLMPASYMNFYISNHSVVVPIYKSAQDEKAVKMICEFYAEKKTVGISAYAILHGGGAFHCITQQEPKP